ncbi:uncharacterized protein LOC114759006 isoform X2 [Neltuma alba]|uniref:uncharacterized protein LOC114759006 isoform X2 n=1 Tax=Neltuma alba TaxID=207710 RepID=UPI0010A564DD|nr:uncharacterized protein LOC114759006 isoform X2 [Prosopis alba]
MVSDDHNVVRLFHQIDSSNVLRRYHLEVGSSIHTLGNDFVTKFISINGFNIPVSNEGMKNMAQKLEVLFLENVQGDFKNIFPSMIPIKKECMKELTEFLLHGSDNIECFIDTTNHQLFQATTVFSRLLKLRIKTMKCFKALCCGPLPFNLFENLQELFIAECSQLHCIVSVGKLNFCNLKHLQLEDCPKLASIFTYSTAQTMVSLEILTVRDCISLKHIIEDEEEDDITLAVPIFQSLKRACVKGCQHLEFIIPASSLGGLSQLESLEIEDASLLKHVFGKYEREEGQNQSESNGMVGLPYLKILKLVDLPNVTSIGPQSYHISWPNVAKQYIKGCPQLSIPSDLDSEAIQQSGGKSREQELEFPAKQSSDMVVESVEKRKEVDEAVVGNHSVHSLSPIMASGSSEFFASHQDKGLPSHTRSTYSNEDRGFAIVPSNIQDDYVNRENQRGNNDIPSGSISTGSDFHLLKQDDTAAEVHPHLQEFQNVDTEEDLQKHKGCPVDSMNLQESSRKTGKGSPHKDTGLEESKVGTSTQELIDKEQQFELDAKVAKVQDATEVHPRSKEFDVMAHTQEGLQEQNFCSVGSMNSRESNIEIAKVSFDKDSAAEEPTVGTSSEVLIDKQPQTATDPQQALQEYKAALPQPVDPTVLSPSTSIATTPLTSEALTSSSTKQHPPAVELVDSHGLFKIKERRARLLDEAFVKYPHLREWKLTQRTPKICKMGYKCLADMLAFLKSETPKTMDDSKMEEFENLYYELEFFGFDKIWLASTRQRLKDMLADHDNKLKQLDQLESQISNLEERLSDARASLASVKDDLAKPGDVFGF